MSPHEKRIGIVIPCFKVKEQIIEVVRSCTAFADLIYVVDDKCPEQSGELVARHGFPDKVRVIFHPQNKGVGGAVISGYRAALAEDCEIIVKVDGDGQMRPDLIPALIAPIVNCQADYVKGNRFFNIEDLLQMPRIRLFGNAALSFVSKVASGYWDIMDPTNGFTAINRDALLAMPLQKLAERYFFESDMLFRLYLARAVVRDLPMKSVYADEISNLNIRRVLLEFPLLYAINFFKRFFYTYIVRDFNAGSLLAVLGIAMLVFGVSFGAVKWISHGWVGETTPLGTIMIASLPIILGTQSLISALTFDIGHVPKIALASRSASRLIRQQALRADDDVAHRIY